ncbi:signal recognition particle-docking protein FtsY [Rhabdothermincola salaria]|uniref:signal recognition particle-docking protein FtsY n=1 Tax=Rhabdothermincola salaria TaxID=2903142 RepID=UPI001E3283B1|nr:signal recognition particle-docking protein FtsY [Rhabdothermincola salaria]MCD9624945.1 signal recognition particle-docking protein FtsY [Rhabdothermincola salaria]
MELVVILVAIAVLGVLFGTGFALVRSRRRDQSTLEEPPPRRAVPPEAATGTLVEEPPTDSAGPVVDEPPAPDTVTEDEAAVIAEAEAAAAAALVEPPEVVRPRFRDRLGKARGLLSGYVGSLTGRTKIDEDTWDELEEALIRADVGVEATQDLLDHLRTQVKAQGLTDGAQLLEALKAELKARLGGFELDLALADGAGPTVWLFVGVNGVGKTTTIGKLGKREADAGHSVVMAAGDTFRAAAAEQLGMWAERSGAHLVRGSEGGDPSAVIFDAVEAAAARDADLVLADTAGRLHTKVNLMDELRKVRRVSDKGAGTVTEVLLVLDATTGQNGLVQASQFTEAVEVTGVVLTKLDGSAKGGIVVAIQTQLGIPVKLVGLGEGADDLVPFDADEFVEALFS